MVGRPQQLDVREQILEQATRLFAARGFEGTSLQHIADAVGIRKPSVLHHFPSKDELRKGVLEKLLSHWNGVLPQVLLAASSGQGQFDGVLSAMTAFFLDDPDRARLLTRELLDRPQEMRELVLRHVAPWVEVVCNYIRKGQERGELRADVDPEAYVIQVINLLVASVATHRALGTINRERNLAEVLRIARASLFRQE